MHLHSQEKTPIISSSINLFFLIFLSFYLQMLTIFIAMPVYACANCYKPLCLAYVCFTCIYLLLFLGNFNINRSITRFFWTTDIHYQYFSSCCLSIMIVREMIFVLPSSISTRFPSTRPSRPCTF